MYDDGVDDNNEEEDDDNDGEEEEDDECFATWMKPPGIRAPPCTSPGTRTGSGFCNLIAIIMIIMVIFDHDNHHRDFKGYLIV